MAFGSEEPSTEYILHKDDSDFPKPVFLRGFLNLVLDRGLAWVEGSIKRVAANRVLKHRVFQVMRINVRRRLCYLRSGCVKYEISVRWSKV
jgi:hypothetical protein